MDQWIYDQAASGALMAAMMTGQQMRIRDSVNSYPPRLIWTNCFCGSTTETTLRDGKQTGYTYGTITVPRQPNFTFTSPPTPGFIIETVLGSEEWWMVDEITNCVGNPAQAPTYELQCSYTTEDAFPNQ